MFGIGMQEMLLILVVALIVIGPKKLPDLAKTLGKALGEFKRATTDLKDSLAADANFPAPIPPAPTPGPAKADETPSADAKGPSQDA